MRLIRPSREPLSAGRLAGSLGLLALALGVTLAVCAGIGSSGYGFLDLLWSSTPAPGIGGGSDPAGGRALAATMIFRLRLPRLLLASIVGAALGATGAVFQAVLRNPLADPYILGISGGAALGAYATTAAGLTALLPLLPVRQMAAFVGAVLTVGFIFALSRVRGRVAAYPMLLIGVVTNTVYLALILFIQTLVEMTRLHGLRIWMVGTIPTEGYWVITSVGALTVLGVGTMALFGRDLNLLSAGEEAARTLGVTVERTRVVVVLLASLVTAAVVSVAGPIGFVGLIVPHGARLLFGPDHRLLVPAAAMSGAIFLAVADTAARTVMAPTELPVGVITALLGGPFFLWLYRTQRGTTYFE
jgi:iron complex transport system permease protein